MNAASTTPLPALCAAVLAHLPTLAARFAQMALHVEISRFYNASTNSVTLCLTLDPQSDTLGRDERRAIVEAASVLQSAGFVWAFVDAHTLRLSNYHGRAVSVPVAPVSQVRAVSSPESEPQVLPAECLTAPTVTFGRHYVERWVKGPAAERRVRALRAAGLSVTTCTKNDTRRLWSEPGADRRTVVVTEIAYCLAQSMAEPPAIVVADEQKRAA